MKSLICVRLFETLMDCSLPVSTIHGIFPGKSTGVGCHFFLQIFIRDDIKKYIYNKNPNLKKVKYLVIEKIKFFSKLAHNRNNKEFQEFCKKIEMQKSR